MMEITFQTKEESNREKQKAFLELEPKDRFFAFLVLCENLKKFPVKTIQKVPSENFIIEFKSHDKNLEGNH